MCDKAGSAGSTKSTQATWVRLAEQSQKLGLAPWSFSKLAALDACPKGFAHSFLHSAPKSLNQKPKYQPETAVAGLVSHDVLERCVKLVQGGSPPDKAYSEFPTIFAEALRGAILTNREMDLVLKQRADIRAVLHRVLKAVSAYDLEVTPEACLVMDSQTGKFSTNLVPYKERMFTLYVDFLGISRTDGSALIIDYKTYAKPKADGKTRNKKRLARDKEQVKFYLLAVMDCFPAVGAAQAGCAYIPSQYISLGALKKRNTHLHTLQRTFQKQIQDSIDLVLTYQKNQKFPARRGRQCSWCTIPKRECGWSGA